MTTKTTNIDKLPDDLNQLEKLILNQCKLWQNDAFDVSAKLAEGLGDTNGHYIAECIRSLKHDNI